VNNRSERQRQSVERFGLTSHVPIQDAVRKHKAVVEQLAGEPSPKNP
jgi:hypothetical protein